MNAQHDRAVQEAAERIIASGVLDTIAEAASNWDLDDRDMEQDAELLARIALGVDPA